MTFCAAAKDFSSKTSQYVYSRIEYIEYIIILIVLETYYINGIRLPVYRSMKIRKKMSGGNVGDMRIGDILCENVSN